MILAFALASALAVATVPASASQSSPAGSSAWAPDGQLFAIVLSPGPKWKPGRPFAEQGLRDHFFYWKALFSAGRIASAGPLGNDHGLVILRAASQADVDAILGGDPAIRDGVFTGRASLYKPPMVDGSVLDGGREQGR